MKFSYPLFAAILFLIAILGSFSGVNNDGVDGFFQSVAFGVQQGDVLLISAALLSGLLAVWVLLVVVTNLKPRK